MESRGSKANRTGKRLEDIINDVLSKTFTYVKAKDFDSVGVKPIFTRQAKLCQSIYDTNLCCDFILYHPSVEPYNLIIESKWQEVKGTADEKFPYLVQNIKEKYPHPTIIVLDGRGYKPEAEKWLYNQIDERLIHVFSLAEFLIWSDDQWLQNVKS